MYLSRHSSRVEGTLERSISRSLWRRPESQYPFECLWVGQRGEEGEGGGI